jgi:hypothetical protein
MRPASEPAFREKETTNGGPNDGAKGPHNLGIAYTDYVATLGEPDAWKHARLGVRREAL